MNSHLAVLPWQTPFVVPAGYFEGLAATLCREVHFSEAKDPILSGFTKALPFEVPQGYFTALTENLVTDATRLGIESVAQMPYSTPAGYFEQLPAKLLAATQAATLEPVRPTQLISFYPSWKKLGRWAAAALLVLGIGFGSYRYLHPVTPERIAARRLSNLDNEAIGSYVEQHVDEFDSEILETALASSHNNLPETLSSLDATEIQDYLRETGEISVQTADETL